MATLHPTHLLRCGGLLSKLDIVSNGARKQHRLLAHNTHVLPKPLGVQVLQVVPTKQDLSTVQIIELLNEVDDSGLASTRRPNQSHHLTWENLQGNSLQRKKSKESLQRNTHNECCGQKETDTTML